MPCATFGCQRDSRCVELLLAGVQTVSQRCFAAWGKVGRADRISKSQSESLQGDKDDIVPTHNIKTENEDEQVFLPQTPTYFRERDGWSSSC